MKFILILVICLLGCNNDKVINEQHIRSIYWTKISSITPLESHLFPGVIYSKQYTDLSFQLSGKLQTLNAIEGQLINKGDVISVLDNEHFQLKLLESKSNLNTKKANYIQVKNEHNRIRNLYQHNLASQAEIDKMNALLNIAKNDLEAGQHKLKLCEKDLQNTMITAPFSGVISNRYVQNNQVVSKGEPVVKILGDSQLQVKFYLPEHLRHKVKIGDSLSVSADSLNMTNFAAQIVEISNPNIKQSSFYVTLSITQFQKSLLAGMSVQVLLKTKAEYSSSEVFTIPINAIDSDMSGLHNIFVFNQSTSKIHKKHIKILDVIQNSAVISGELSEGNIIASAGVNVLQDNQTVFLYKNYNK